MTAIRVLHVITDTDSGGAEVMLRNVTTRMDPARFENRVVSMMDAGSLAPSFAAGGVDVQSLGMHRGRPDPRALWRLVRMIRRFRPHVVQTWLYHADLLGSVAAWLARAPVLAWNLRNSGINARFGLSTRISLRLLAHMSRLPDAVATNSRVGQQVHEALGYRPAAWKFLPNGFDVELFRPDEAARARIRASLGIPGDATVVGLFARFHPSKDHRTFFDAVRIAGRPNVPNVPNVHYVFAGRGTEAIPALARELAPQARIHALGERHDVPALTASLDIACSTSAFGEGFPNTIGEAMACAVPCVVTDSGDARWLVDDAGSVVPPRDPAQFARALGIMLDATAEERRAIGAHGRARVVRDFSIESVVRQYEDFYDALVADSARTDW
jgi:glycosyltransferase involved in cell wall biosynthesis